MASPESDARAASAEVPESISVLVNGSQRRVARGASVRDLVVALDLRPALVAVEVNRALVPRARHAEQALAEGDRVEIVTLVGGG